VGEGGEVDEELKALFFTETSGRFQASHLKEMTLAIMICRRLNRIDLIFQY